MSTSDNTSNGQTVEQLMEAISKRRSRRTILSGAMMGAGAVGAVVAGVPLSNMTALAATNTSASCIDSVQTILTVARTAEQLAITFYTNGIANADKLGIRGSDLAYLKAALVEEQIHQLFFTANGGQSLATTFSFPHGKETFEDLQTFIATQQQLEGVFDSAFLAAVKEFAELNQPGLAQIAAQIACIESEHRALGRAIGGLVPADNWAFAPVLVPSVGAAPKIVADAGYLSPRAGNSYTYHQVSISSGGVIYRKPYAVPCS